MKKVLLTLGIITASGIFLSASTSALTYQESVDVKFTFNPTVNISLTSADLIISNLAPGNYADSNIIDVIVSTNNETGYTLYATAGDGTTYTNTNLINGSNNFSSVSTSADLPSMNNASDNEWAYSFSTNSGSTWSNYSGLPYYTQTGKTLFATNTNSPITVNFKIGAKASSAQPSGTYRNIVNFIAVTNPMPPEPVDNINDLTYMQEFATLTSTEKTNVLSSMTEGAQYQLMDSRDNKTYYISKLADGNVWMTQNLDHDIVTTQNFYTYNNTDIGHGSTPDTSATWTANRATASGWNDEEMSLVSSVNSYNPGDYCWSGVANDSILVTCNQNSSHYHLGNYYNFPASVAMNIVDLVNTNSVSADQSICPSGWTLPNTQTIRDLINNYSSTTTLDDGSILWGGQLYFGLSGTREGNDIGQKAAWGGPIVRRSQQVVVGDGMMFVYNVSRDKLAIVFSVGNSLEDGVNLRCIAR